MYDRMTIRPCGHTTVQPYNCTTIQGTTFNMRDQLYCRHANTTALSISPVVSALGSESDNPEPLRRAGKKNASSLLGLAKSIY